jgi:hypothetical protein
VRRDPFTVAAGADPSSSDAPRASWKIDDDRCPGIHRRPGGVEDLEDVVDVELIVGHLRDDARLGPEDDDALDRRPGRERAILGRPLLRFRIDPDQHDANPRGADRDFATPDVHRPPPSPRAPWCQV